MSARWVGLLAFIALSLALARTLLVTNSDSFLGDGWAQWAMVFVSAIALGVSLWAVYLLDLQLKATRLAISEAEKATVAAIDTVDLTRELGNKELRPWVMATQPTFGFSANTRLPDGTDTQTLIAFLSFKNYGKNPAANVGIYTEYHIVGHDEAPEIVAPDLFGNAPIAPTDEVHTQIQHFYGNDLLLVLDGKASILLYGKVVYEDPFVQGQQYVTECLLLCRYQGNVVDEYKKVHPNFIPRPFGSQNRVT